MIASICDVLPEWATRPSVGSVDRKWVGKQLRLHLPRATVRLMLDRWNDKELWAMLVYVASRSKNKNIHVDAIAGR